MSYTCDMNRLREVQRVYAPPQEPAEPDAAPHGFISVTYDQVEQACVSLERAGKRVSIPAIAKKISGRTRPLDILHAMSTQENADKFCARVKSSISTIETALERFRRYETELLEVARADKTISYSDLTEQFAKRMGQLQSVGTTFNYLKYQNPGLAEALGVVLTGSKRGGRAGPPKKQREEPVIVKKGLVLSGTVENKFLQIEVAARKLNDNRSSHSPRVTIKDIAKNAYEVRGGKKLDITVDGIYGLLLKMRQVDWKRYEALKEIIPDL